MSPTIERTVTTTAAPEKVFPYLVDFRNATEWDSGTESCERVSGDGGPGTVYKNVSKFAGNTVELEYTVDAVEQPRFVIVGRNDTTTSQDTITVTPREGGLDGRLPRRLHLHRARPVRRSPDEAPARPARRQDRRPARGPHWTACERTSPGPGHRRHGLHRLAPRPPPPRGGLAGAGPDPRRLQGGRPVVARQVEVVEGDAGSPTPRCRPRSPTSTSRTTSCTRWTAAATSSSATASWRAPSGWRPSRPGWGASSTCPGCTPTTDR